MDVCIYTYTHSHYLSLPLSLNTRAHTNLHLYAGNSNIETFIHTTECITKLEMMGKLWHLAAQYLLLVPSASRTGDLCVYIHVAHACCD